MREGLGPTEGEEVINDEDAETPKAMDLNEKFKRDRAIELGRGEKEPPIGDNEIMHTQQLEGLQGKVVKYTRDNGKSWNYALLDPRGKMRFESGDGYLAYEELMPHTQVHAMFGFTEGAFERYHYVVRPTNPEEWKGIQFSYDNFPQPESEK